MNQARPNIALLHYSALPTIGGVELVLAEQARLLAEAGYPARIVVGRGEAGGLPAGVSFHRLPEIDSEFPRNLEIGQALERGEMPPDFASLANEIEAGLARALHGTDLVLAHNVLTMHFNLPLVAALHRLLDQGARWRVAAWCHDLSRYVRADSGADQRSGFPWDLLRKHRPEAGYVAVSAERQRQLAATLGVAPETIRVVPNGVDAVTVLGLSPLGRRLAAGFDLLAGDVVLLMPVRVTRAKNIELALRLTAALKALGAQPRLVVTGPPDPHVVEGPALFDELLALRAGLGLEREAFFVYEGVPGAEGPLEIDTRVVGELFRLCDVVLMPSHREGFGIPVLEAGLAGRPVFATAVPAVELVGEDLVHLIKPGDPPEWVAERIWRLAEQDRAQRLRRQVRRDYTWPSLFRSRIEPLIAELCAPAAKGGLA